MNHYIITRFNLCRPGDKHLNPDWLDYRFTLFDRFCYATMRSQSNQNFKWFVLFHPTTPRIYRERVEDYASWKPFIPVFVDGRSGVSNQVAGMKGWPGSIPGRQVCQQILDESGGRWIITTRLDNDDAVAVDFTSTIQRAARETEETLNFPSGWKWYRGVLHRCAHPNNPFLSYVEKAGDQLKTVFQYSHGTMTHLTASRQVGSSPQWMMVCHGDNISNRCTTARPVNHPFWTKEPEILKRFSLDLSVPLPKSAVAGKPFITILASKPFRKDFFDTLTD